MTVARLGPLLIAQALAGCGSVPSTHEAPDVPATAWLAPALRADSLATATVVVKRSTVITFSICDVRVYVNGNGTVDIAPGQRALLTIRPGRHMMGADTPAPLCPVRLREVALDLAPGQTATFAIDASPLSGEFVFQQSSR